MIKNYFKTAFRSLWKNKTAGFINLFGLSIGMTAAVFIFLWVQNEMNFDNYHPGKENIYRITNTIQLNKDDAWVWETSPMLMAENAVKEIPEVQKTARVLINTWGAPVLKVDHKLFTEKTSAWVDKSWFNMFHYDFIKGSAADFAKDPFSIILTASKAKKYFGDADPTGQIIKVDTVNYTVQAVIKDNPVNSSFQFDVLLQMEGRLSDPAIWKNDKTWNNFGYTTFMQLRPDANVPLVETKLNELVNRNRTNHNDKVSLQSLTGMYFENDLQSSEMQHGSKKAAYIFSLLGLLLLITACINYVNLTTAKASLRAKEVSIRKIAGAYRKHLFSQFIAESLTMSFLALIITVVLIRICLPVFNTLTERNFELPLSSVEMWKVLLGTLFIATLLNGIYPALLLSSFQPLNVFRGKSILQVRDVAVRKGLVVFQFSLSMVLILGTIVIYRQLNFIQSANPGYNVSQVMALEIPYHSYGPLKGDSRKSFFAAIKQELQAQSSIAMVSSGNAEIVNVTSASSGNADWDGRDTLFNPTIGRLSIDQQFPVMFRLQLKEGNWFKPGTENSNDYILNETAAATFNMHQPVIGQRFTWGGDTGKVVGIVKDFHYKSMHEKIGPMVLTNNDGTDSYFFIKTAPGNISKAISAAETVWSKYIPTEPFQYTFLDESFTNLYKSDIKTSRLVFIFSAIAVVIAALGLFALAAFTAERKTKEIGIRKVLGASVSQIAGLLSKDFIKLVLVAIIAASPLAWWAMNKWLEDFAYRINISAWIFIIAGSFALLVAILSVSVQAVKAATANPVKSLRTE